MNIVENVDKDFLEDRGIDSSKTSLQKEIWPTEVLSTIYETNHRSGPEKSQLIADFVIETRKCFSGLQGLGCNCTREKAKAIVDKYLDIQSFFEDLFMTALAGNWDHPVYQSFHNTFF